MAIHSYDRLLIRGGTEIEWLKYDPILKENEEALVWFNKDKTHPEKICMIKHGDGLRKFSELPYDDSRDRRYTATVPITDNIGGFNAGEQPIEIPYHNIIDKLLHPYVSPDVLIVSESIQPGIYKRGDDIELNLKITIIEKSHAITNLYSVETNTDINGSEEITSNSRLDVLSDPSIEQDPDNKYNTKIYQDKVSISNTTNISKYTVSYDALDVINDSRNDSDFNSNILEYKFVDPIYLGYISSSISDITANNIDSSFKKEIITDSNSISWNYSVDDAKIMILYPAEKGELKNVKDINGLELINSFTIQDIVYNNIDYKIAIFNNVIYDSKGTLICKFDKMNKR